MKKLLLSFSFLLFLFAHNSTVFAQAHVQFIHNSPDPSLPAIDIYINGSLSYSHISFRHATSFISLPSSGQLSIGIVPADSSINDIIKNINITLQKDSFYYFITSGVLDTSQFAHNPDSVPLNFTVNIFSHASGSYSILYDCGLQFFNGSTDASLFNLYGREQRQMLFSKVGYGQFGPSYQAGLVGQPIVVDFENPVNNNVISTYLAYFGLNLAGKTALIFSSGFNNPALNQNGSAFGLFAALPNGSVVPLTDTAIASLQLIHNSADPSASAFDVYVNSSLLTSYLYFRFATPYLDVPGNAPLHIGLAPAGSGSAAEVTDSFTATLNNAESYVGILSGVLNTNGFKQNPNNRNISLNLFEKSNARQIALDSSKVDFFFFNGSTDEPAIDVKPTGTITLLADSIAYGDMSSYSEMNPRSYNFDITSAVNSNDILATYDVDLSLYRSKAITIFTSGFVDSVNNNNGASLGLFGAFNDGSVIQFPPLIYSSRVQFINNIADPSLSSVAIFLNGNSIINNLPFRKATYYSGVPAGITLNVGIAPSGTILASDAVSNHNVTLAPNSTNIVMLNGVLDTSGFAANPNGKNISLSLVLIDSAHTTAAQNMVGIKMVHGATDESMNDFVLDGTLPPLIDNIEYGGVKPYVSVSASTHTFNMTDANNDNTIIKKYDALFSAYGGTALTVFSSGFLNPAANHNGPAFGLFAADTLGNVFPLTDVTGVENINSTTGIIVYPNPASGNVIVNNKGNEPVYVQLTDLSGKQIKYLGTINNNSSRNFSLGEIADGIYIIQAISTAGVENLKLVIQK